MQANGGSGNETVFIGALWGTQWGTQWGLAEDLVNIFRKSVDNW